MIEVAIAVSKKITIGAEIVAGIEAGILIRKKAIMIPAGIGAQIGAGIVARIVAGIEAGIEAGKLQFFFQNFVKNRQMTAVSLLKVYRF